MAHIGNLATPAKAFRLTEAAPDKPTLLLEELLKQHTAAAGQHAGG
jgi:hypothetical protein